MKRERRGTVWSRGTVCAVLLLVTAGAILFRAHLPSAFGIGSLVETFLPWLGGRAAAPARRAGATLGHRGHRLRRHHRRSRGRAWTFHDHLSDATALATTTWSSSSVESHKLRVIAAGRRRRHRPTVPRSTAAWLADNPRRLRRARAFGMAVPYHETYGTVGVWSAQPRRTRHPSICARRAWTRRGDVGCGWRPDLADRTPVRIVAVYAVHLPSIRLGVRGLDVTARNGSIGLLAEAPRADDAEVVIVSGDFNADAGDRALRPVISQVSEPQDRFGFTFPAALPAIRIDHVFARGAEGVEDVRPLDGGRREPVITFPSSRYFGAQ